tara:strand:+ start:212 stop:505 length:294 start_codon:yes stop_codon:yes gene_type:complete
MRKKHLITFLTLIVMSGSLTSPAKSNFRKSGFGEGTAAFACFLLWEGYSKYEVESLISRFARRIEKSNFSEEAMNQMALGYRNQIKITNDCDLRMRY